MPVDTPPNHLPVLVDEVLTALDPHEGETCVDLTLGRGGHASVIAGRVGAGGRIVGFDLDEANVKHCRALAEVQTKGEHPAPAASACAVWSVYHGNFRTAPDVLRAAGLRADMILADLGFASSQMDDPQRGFSFRADGPLDMRLDPSQHLTAARLVNESREEELARIIYSYGEEPLSRKIAARILAERKLAPILTTARLASLVEDAYGSRSRFSRMHPATRTFMALRIAVNDELGNVEAFLGSLHEESQRTALRRAGEQGGWVNPGCRVAFISFHSLEDRLVKRAFARLEADGLGRRLNRKPVTAGPAEIARNPRARSAKLRALRIASPDAGGARPAERYHVES